MALSIAKTLSSPVGLADPSAIVFPPSAATFLKESLDANGGCFAFGKIVVGTFDRRAFVAIGPSDVSHASIAQSALRDSTRLADAGFPERLFELDRSGAEATLVPRARMAGGSFMYTRQPETLLVNNRSDVFGDIDPRVPLFSGNLKTSEVIRVALLDLARSIVRDPVGRDPIALGAAVNRDAEDGNFPPRPAPELDVSFGFTFKRERT